MSNKYYYLIASLPLLEFGMKPPLSSEDFLTECKKLLALQDYALVKKVLEPGDLTRPSNNKFLSQWMNFIQNFRNELAWIRSTEANKDPANYIRGQRIDDPNIVDLLAPAVEAEDPLSAEKLLDSARWQNLDELSQWHYFDLELLIVYAIKLKILERYQEIESPKGKELFAEYKKIEIPALN